MGKLFKFFLIILGIFSFFIFGISLAEEDIPDVVINEVMANPSCPPTNTNCDYDLEWIEVFNSGSTPVNIGGWKIDETVIPIGIEIPANDYLVIARELIDGTDGDMDSFEAAWGDASGIWGDNPVENYLAIDGTMSLTNTQSDSIILDNQKTEADNYRETFSWDETEDGITWQRIPLTNEWALGHCGETPGTENCVQAIPPPLAPSGISPTNFQTIPFTDQVVFQWKTTDTQPQNFEFILFDQLNPSNIIIDESDLTSFQYEVTNLLPNIYCWQVIASNQTGETPSPIYTFTLYNPVYSDAIVINELMPNPSGDETKNEWIELCNNSDEAVDLNGWHLKDLYGSTHDFVIFNIKGTIIGPHQFLIFYRSETNITLNNDTDGVVLIQPNGKILNQTVFSKGGKEGWSWARDKNGKFSWTVSPTPLKKNIIEMPVETSNEESQTKEPINTIPIEIKTGEYQDYLDKLVKISGKVTSTSGNTFYLDDGSGVVKIYIQEKTGIDKPEMHKNDIFEVIGIVDLYGKTWRILPQNQDDIKLVEAAPKIVKSSTAKASTKKASVAAKSSTSSATAKSAKGGSSELDTEKANEKSPFWIQFIKTILGLSIIFFVILIVKVLRAPKPKIIGGHFGDDET
ncbi:hypothetical protein A2V71_03210 [Candidatus Berkelbacteria bacterium RBG_13_40_8]|uniref:LTD domain-containing protein n=1 Tax=Candidatus Berkelbacteria bacterium RBG_13_40_8 TaxID=1797467 RepID=A0A1F5DPB3_9BACT|nr:MAG: hypothetical protein A2V71_03210 [Candidatus Berkelbacteria bacterium RBG_13_40_8]